jgi:hypothetical protein
VARVVDHLDPPLVVAVEIDIRGADGAWVGEVVAGAQALIDLARRGREVEPPRDGTIVGTDYGVDRETLTASRHRRYAARIRVELRVRCP